MKEQSHLLTSWTKTNKPFALATVIQTWGSSPRPVGSTMLISQEMDMAGSVSGGCVEGAVVRAALPMMEKGEGRSLHFGVADEDAWAVGLSCGGKMHVFVERFFAFDERAEEQAAWAALNNCLENKRPCVLLTTLTDGQTKHVIVLPDGTSQGYPLPPELLAEALRSYRERKSQVLEIEKLQDPAISQFPIFAQVFPRRSLMLIVGAAHLTADLVRLAQFFDFETVVMDPRGIFTHKTQFPVPPDHLFDCYPAEVLPDFPLDAYTYAVILSHDPKIDDNALHILLRSGVGYIGALGSKKTHEKRVNRLRDAGFSEAEIGRIHAPIGVDIRAKTPGEIALSVMGEIIRVKNEFL